MSSIYNVSDVWNDCPMCGASLEIFMHKQYTYLQCSAKRHYQVNVELDGSIRSEYFYTSSPDKEYKFTIIRYKNDIGEYECGVLIEGRAGRTLGDIILPIDTNTKYFTSYDNLIKILNLV